MIAEIRRYRLKVGTLHEYVELYRNEGFNIQSKYLGSPKGWHMPLSGNQNIITHIWHYENFDDRDQRRKALFADADWLAFIKETVPLIESMESEFHTPIDFGATA